MLTFLHPKLIEKIEDIVPLRKHDDVRSSNYFYSYKVMEPFHVFHFESTGEELLYMLNIY